ncbi:uncharacterized protein LOC116338427 isoform X2 [Contarinia nasturtii]|uniref:uncharacterized protein LOC116338427 isoform X2 n=1 Tax=Contarinia nasturtii TaxID=265458 RepID=UPI0012D39F6C|nr:uncharacterized protein LOC116338427 isoform X2 [Contarinia nasturtii]
MAAVNSVQGGLRLPLAGIASPRLLMCSASMGAEGSVTLQLREAVEAPDSSGQSDTTALTIGYPETDLLADIQGSIQATVGSVVSKNSVQSNGTVTVTTVPVTTTNGNSNINVNRNQSSNTNVKENVVTTAQNKTTTIASSAVAVTVATVKKSRPKTSSPTRHGPQQCQVCSKVFGNASALAKHKLTHSDERKYVCGMCSKAFKRQDHLNGHMLTHRNKKPYECKAEGCGKSYCDARSLRRHTENHHNTVATAPTTPNQSISSTGPLGGLSLSPATASGDASSPHGSNCLQFNGNGVGGDGSKSPSLPAATSNEGLSRQQLELISQIMQQTKPNVSLTSANQQNGQKSIPRPRTWNIQTQLQQTQTKSEVETINTTSNATTTLQSTANGNTVKTEQKPVECNLCHRKFKNIPALNGHMRLHGGYFKKDAEAKKCDKKETPGPPLQTASVGIRALIEEKIISKRGKDILKNSFAVPAPPTLSRRLIDADNFVAPKTLTTTNVVTPSQISNAITSIPVCQTTTMTNVTPTTIAKNIQLSTNLNKQNSIETKDATLIELLKRGTKVAVKCNSNDTNGSTLTFKSNATQQTTTTGAATTTVLLPTNVTVSSPVTPTTSPLGISLSNNSVKNTPLALTISQNANGSSDVYTLAYSTDATSTFFNENDVYNVPDTAMLLQAVDSIQLLQNSSGSSQLGDISTIGEYALADGGDLNDTNILSQYTPSRQIQAVLNSPLPESLAEFSTLHSKDFVLYGTESENDDSPTAHTSNSSLPTSPLSYPTPPASHEGITQSSPFLDDTHHFGDANSIFDDKKNISFLDENGLFKDIKDTRLSDCEQILKLKHELFNDTKVVMDDTLYFKSEIKNEYNSKSDLANANNHTENIDEFNQNLSFLDESRNFLVDSRNPSSPLSAAFFTSTMSSAEEVKEALQEVLPNESIACEQNNDIDLYYLPSAAFQSQMMLNSDDPLLSSSPKDFIIKHPINRFEFESGSSAKKQKLDGGGCVNIEKSKILITNQTEKMHTETFLSPSNLPINAPTTVANSTTNSTTTEFTQPAHQVKENIQCYAKSSQMNVRRNIAYKSILRKASAPYYTPSPILDPKRIAPGLYAEVSKDTSEDMIDFEFAESACVPEFTRKFKVNIGSDFQAIIPSTETAKSAYENDKSERELPLWKPNVLQNEKQIQRFVELAKSSAVPLACHSEEMALKALLNANGDIPNAILKMLHEPPSSIHNRWQPQEVETFLNGLETHGKNFYKISKEIPSKTTGDCVQFYYFWKKLCVHYKSTHLSSELFNSADGNSINATNQQEARPHVCEMPDCSASFTSKAALHGHTRIHCIGRGNTFPSSTVNGQSLSGYLIK